MPVIDIRNMIETSIVKSDNLKKATNDLYNVFGEWEKKNAELVNKFFNQAYFSGEDSLLDKFLEVEPNMDFDYIREEGINIALLLNNDWMWDFKSCMDKITNNSVKIAFMQKIFDKVQSEIWSWAPYDNFATECALPWDTNVIWYFQTVVDYLTWKENSSHWKKMVDILKNVFISNEDLNSMLPTWEQIPAWVLLSSSTIPTDTVHSFDALLSFEIWKEANRAIEVADDIAKNLWSLFTNSLPAINTVVWENDIYKFDEDKLWPEYKWALQAINDDDSLEDDQKDIQINKLKWEYYLQYLKSENKALGETLQQLYDNDFDYSKIGAPTLESYLDKITDIRLKMLFTSGANEILKINFWNYDEFSDFYKKLANPSENTIQLRPWINLPIEKKIIEWKNMWLKDIDEFWKEAKAFDTLPITYTIKEEDVNNLPLDMDDRIRLLYFLQKFKTDGENYIIKWEDVWMLIYLFFVVNSRTPITSFDLDKQEDIERLFGEAKNNDKNSWWENNEWEDPSQQNEEWENNEWEDPSQQNEDKNEELTPEKFKEEIEKLWPWKFENGSEIWLPYWKSKLPWGWYQWVKIKISNVDMTKWTFTGTFFWGELEFSKIEWKSVNFGMNEKALDTFKNAAKEGSGNTDMVYLLPNPEKSDFNSFRDNLGTLWTTVLSFPISWITRDGNKFMQKVVDENWKEKEVEVKYFGTSADDKSTYKIDYHPGSHSFTVYSSFYWEEKWKNWESEKKRLSYRREMDWNNFLIFFTQKWLYPQTKEEADHAIMRQEEEVKIANGGHRKLNWFSINNLKHWFKDIFWTLKKWIENYDKKQDEKFKRLVEERILNGLSVIPFLTPALKSAIWEYKQDIYNQRNNAAWQEIEWYLKTYQSDPDFASTFDKAPPFSKELLWGRSYQSFLIDLKKNGNRNESEVRKAAALLLANIEKWKSPYRGLVSRENKWYWVKVLLGEWHYNRFLSDKERCLNQINKAWKNKVQLQDILASCEMDYIINNVRWNPDPEFFWSHEVPWDSKNPDNLSKRLLSSQFADKLDDLNKWWFTASSVEWQFDTMKHNDFNLAKKTFEKNIKSARYQSAAAGLKKMFTLACDDDQILMYKRCFLIYLLSGAIDVNCRKDLWKQAYLWWKSLWFPPALLAKNKGHPEQVVAMLDHFSKDNPANKFSNKVKSYFHKSSELQWSPNIENLITDFDKRWKENDNANRFCNYLKWDFLITKNFETWDSWMDKILKDLQWKANDQSNESVDNSLFCNAKCINDAWILAAPDTIQNRMRTTSEWAFAWETWDEKDDRASFFTKCANEIEEIQKIGVNQEYTNLLMNKFLWWFWLTATETKSEIYKRIATAEHYKNEIEKNRKKIWPVYHPAEERKVKIKNKDGEQIMKVPLWTITIEDVKKILWYWLEWRAWRQQKHYQQIPEELRKCFDAFQNYFWEAFDKWFLTSPSIKNDIFKVNIFDRGQYYQLWWWDIYKSIKKTQNDTIAVVWEDSISETNFTKLSNNEKKNIRKPIFSQDKYLNDDMYEMEKQFADFFVSIFFSE